MKKNVCIFLFGMSASCFAYYKDYSPFPRRDPELFPLERIKLVRGDSGDEKLHCYNFIATGKTHKVIINWDFYDSYSVVSLSDLSGVPVLADFICDNSLNLIPKVYTGRLNDDDVDDWVIDIFTATSGDVKIDNVLRVVILAPPGGNSSVTGKVIQFWTVQYEFNDFVDLNHDGRPEMIFPDIIVGKVHENCEVDRYWTHNLVQFKGMEMVSANHVDRRFPFWVLCTDEPNHKPTMQLSKEQRVRLWRKQAPVVFKFMAEEQ